MAATRYPEAADVTNLRSKSLPAQYTGGYVSVLDTQVIIRLSNRKFPGLNIFVVTTEIVRAHQGRQLIALFPLLSLQRQVHDRSGPVNCLTGVAGALLEVEMSRTLAPCRNSLQLSYFNT